MWQLVGELEGRDLRRETMGCAPSVHAHPLGHRVPVGKGAWATQPGSRVLALFHVPGCQLDTSHGGDVWGRPAQLGKWGGIWDVDAGLKFGLGCQTLPLASEPGALTIPRC